MRLVNVLAVKARKIGHNGGARLKYAFYENSHFVRPRLARGPRFGWAFAQVSDSAFAWQKDVVLSAANGDTGDAEKLANFYQKAVGNAELTRAAAQVAFRWDKRAAPTDTSLLALQTMQNQKMIEQNTQIIALLKAKK